MTAAASRPFWAAGISILAHAAALAALIWVVVPVKTAPPVLPQIELLPPLPITPAPQDARPSPINLPVAPQPAPPAQYAPPVPVPNPPPVIQGASQEDAQAPPPKPRQRPRRKPPPRPQPIPVKEVTRSETPPAAAPTNGNETKRQTVIAEAQALPQPAGPPPDYIGLIRARLERVKQYPPEAREDREEGTVMLSFSLDRSGQVLHWHIARGSGIAALDAEAAAMIARAAPFPPFPKTFNRSTLDLLVPIEFSLRRS